MLEVKEAAYAGNYAVFSNGRAGTADLEQLAFNDRRPIFLAATGEVELQQLQDRGLE